MSLTNVLNQASLNIQLQEIEDGYFVAECVDIPGCISQGSTRDEALVNIVDAISVCLEIITERAVRQLKEKPGSAQGDSFRLSLATSDVQPVAECVV